MRISAHILAIIAIIVCLVSTGQAKAIHVSTENCPTSESQSLTSEQAALTLAGTLAETAPALSSSMDMDGPDSNGDMGPQGDGNKSLKMVHCTLCWADLSSGLTDLDRAKAASLQPLSFDAGQGLHPAALERPPKPLLS